MFNTYFPSKMQERPTLTEFFKNRIPQPLTPPKASKKSKPSTFNQQEDDPLQKILSWRDTLKESCPIKQGTYQIQEVESIIKDDQKSWGNDYEGILINVDWENISFEQFSQLQLSEKLIDNGIVFVWGSNSNIGDLFKYFSTQGFQYVQNFMFVMLDRQKIPLQRKIAKNKNSLLNYFKRIQVPQQKQKNTTIIKDYETGKVSKPQQIFFNSPSQYFGQSQRVLYLFRKQNKSKTLELRHQRTSDAYFTIEDSFKLGQKSMAIVYQMIETLLIKANYKQGRALKLLELWGGSIGRKGWKTIVQNKNTQK